MTRSVRTPDRRTVSIDAALDEPERGPSARVPLLEPTFAGNEWSYLRECLDTGWVSSAGPFVARFERAVADYTGARHAIATVTGSAALHLALRLIGLEPDEEVLVPDLTFVAPLHVVRQCGAHPVLIDAAPDTFQIDPGQIEAFLKEECVVRGGHATNRRSGRRVRAILAVHLLGLPCEIERIVELARRHRLAVVEDAAQAIGARYRGRHVGTFGDVGILSFNGNKVITAGGGGMLLVGDAGLADRARRLAGQAEEEESGEIGYNYRLSSLQAALGLAQLEQLDALLDRKRAIADRYSNTLAQLGSALPMPAPPHTRPSFWLYTMRVADAVLGSRRGAVAAARDAVVGRLAEHGIEATPLWRPMHELRVHRDVSVRGGEEAARLHARSICLPSSAGLRAADQDTCIEVLASALRSLDDEA